MSPNAIISPDAITSSTPTLSSNTPLENLPPEVKINIFSNLDVKNLLKVRLLSKEFKALHDDPRNNAMLYKAVQAREIKRIEHLTNDLVFYAASGKTLLDDLARYVAVHGVHLVSGKHWGYDLLDNWLFRADVGSAACIYMGLHAICKQLLLLHVSVFHNRPTGEKHLSDDQCVDRTIKAIDAEVPPFIFEWIEAVVGIKRQDVVEMVGKVGRTAGGYFSRDIEVDLDQTSASALHQWPLAIHQCRREPRHYRPAWFMKPENFSRIFDLPLIYTQYSNYSGRSTRSRDGPVFGYYARNLRTWKLVREVFDHSKPWNDVAPKEKARLFEGIYVY